MAELPRLIFTAQDWWSVPLKYVQDILSDRLITQTHTHTHTHRHTHSCINFHVLFFREVAIIFVSFGICRLCRNIKWSFSYERKLTLSNYIFNLKWLNLYHRKWNLFEKKERENDDIIYKKNSFLESYN